MDANEIDQAIGNLLMDAAAVADALMDAADSGDAASLDKADKAAAICALLDELSSL